MIGALIGMLLIASELQAATVTTPPLEPEPNGTLVCAAVNVSSRSRDVTLWVFDGSGNLVTFNEGFDLAMGAICSSSTTTTPHGTARSSWRGARAWFERH